MSRSVRAAVGEQRERIRARRKIGFAYRVIVAVVGVAIIAVGLVMLPLPGPGWLVIFLGLGVLASEFAWARSLLDYARDKVGAWTDWVRRQSFAVRSLLAVACLTIVAAAAWGYVAWRGVPGWIPLIG